MANPTGSTYLTANLSYTWADGDVYQIPQTDQLEGAATGASFGGQGVVNQPHQLLLNKIQYTHTRQLADEANITVLQTFVNLFTSTVGPSGYLKLGMQDSVKGQIDVVVQWGAITFTGANFNNLSDKITVQPFSFPIAFPNACWRIYPYWEVNSAIVSFEQTYNNQVLQNYYFVLPTPMVQTPIATQNNTIVITWPSGWLSLAHQVPSNVSANIGWLAIGY